MRRRNGMLLSVMLAAVLVLTGVASAQDVSVFTFKHDKLEHRYGIQVSGGFATYLMEDVNDYLAQGQTEASDKASFGIGFSFAFLYRSSENYRWNIGYSILGQAETTAAWGGGADENTLDQTVSGSEIFIMGDYNIYDSDNLDFYVGGGPIIVTANMDRSSNVASSFYDAKGRAYGLRLQLGGEFLLSETFGLNLQAGYRFAKVTKLEYEDRDGNEEGIYWGSGDRRFSVDFSGIYVELGLRLYFKPATDWVKL